MTSPLRDFLEIPYDELEELNLQMKALRLARTPVDILREERCRYLADEKRIKAVTVCFADLEGRLHMLDYDKTGLSKTAHTRWMISAFANFLPGSRFSAWHEATAAQSD